VIAAAYVICEKPLANSSEANASAYKLSLARDATSRGGQLQPSAISDSAEIRERVKRGAWAIAFREGFFMCRHWMLLSADLQMAVELAVGRRTCARSPNRTRIGGPGQYVQRESDGAVLRRRWRHSNRGESATGVERKVHESDGSSSLSF